VPSKDQFSDSGELRARVFYRYTPYHNVGHRWEYDPTYLGQDCDECTCLGDEMCRADNSSHRNIRYMGWGSVCDDCPWCQTGPLPCPGHQVAVTAVFCEGIFLREPKPNCHPHILFL
jgi:hypothetical protein